MLQEYCGYIDKLKQTRDPKIKAVKNLIVNVSKDLLLVLDDFEPLQLGIVIPCLVRDMKKTQACERWIQQVSKFGFGLWCMGYQKEDPTSSRYHLHVKLENRFYKLEVNKDKLSEYLEQMVESNF